MTGKELYQIARKYLGKGGSIFRKFCGLGGGAPWCCAYVCYMFITNKLGKLFYGGKKVTYCPTAIKWCQANLAQLPLYMAMPMDIAFFDWNHNGIPDHIGFVKAKISSDKIQTHEGNTSGGIVAEKTRTVAYMMGGVFRPHYAPKGLKKEKLAVDGDFGYKSIYMMQVWLGVGADGILGKVTLKAFQKKLGVAPDGAWGRKTTLAAQRLVGVKQDGAWGPASTRAFQAYINSKVFPSVSGSTTAASNAQKIVDKVSELAWPYGTAPAKWDYKKGAPTSKCKAAMEEHGYTTKEKMSSCIYAVNTVIRETGINKKFCAGHGYNKPYPKTEDGFNTVLSGKSIPSGFLQPGDIVRYKKTNKDEHTLIYMGNGRIAEARHYHRFFNIYKDQKRYNGSKSKKSTLQVLRAK